MRGANPRPTDYFNMGVPMTIYLTIITTVLVLTQVIRVVQNAIQLRHIKRTDRINKEINAVWSGLEDSLNQAIAGAKGLDGK